MTKQTTALASPCAEREENLVLFHYGDLDPAERSALQAHLQNCTPCAGYLKDLETLLPLTVKADEPSETFWTDYNREMRRKLADAAETKTWLQKIGEFFQARPLPALATTAVLVLALTLTFGRNSWSPHDPVQEDAAIMEVLPVAENLEFFKNMDVLDNLELLESMGKQSDAA
jgi:Putative zinc-finger